MKVKLTDIIDAMDFTDDNSEHYLDKVTGEIVYINDMYMDRAEVEELSNQLDEHDCFRLPDQRELNDYAIMEDFVSTLSGSAQEKLEDAISGRGAFSRFKNGIRQLGLQDQWFAFRDEAYKRKAIAWCEENGVEWE